MRLGVSSDGKTISQVKIIPTLPDFNEGVEAIIKAGRELWLGQNIQGVAGGIAGPMNKDRSMMSRSPHIPGWVNKPIKAVLEKQFGCKVVLENDTVVGGVGEAVKGGGAGKSVVAYVAIGTGVGGKRIIDGKIDDKSYNFEPGHQVIIPDGNFCHCGGKGHLEAYIGGAYIEEKYNKKAEEINDTAIWDEIAKYLALGLTNTIVHWDPDIVVLGGSVMKSISLDAVKKYLKENLTIYPQTPELVLATLGQDAGLYGALELLRVE